LFFFATIETTVWRIGNVLEWLPAWECPHAIDAKGGPIANTGVAHTNLLPQSAPTQVKSSVHLRLKIKQKIQNPIGATPPKSTRKRTFAEKIIPATFPSENGIPNSTNWKNGKPGNSMLPANTKFREGRFTLSHYFFLMDILFSLQSQMPQAFGNCSTFVS
jgi:hypothetical protein